ncbi:MAG: hypothetical protein ACU84J_01990 [Gammaproteobacteria bacterium]
MMKSGFPFVQRGLALCILSAILALSITDEVSANGGIVVVANKESIIDHLSRDEVSLLFLGKSKFSNGVPVTVIDSDDANLRNLFYSAVANMNALHLKAYWSRIVFAGQGRPPQEVSIEDARSRIEKKPDVLTYLPENKVTKKMKIIYRTPETSFLEQ